MDFGIDVSQHQLSWDDILSRTRYAEGAGFNGAWVFDHFRALYGDPSGPCLEGWSLLAALGAATQEIRLGALVTGVTYRHPSVLAAQAVTVDHVSNGRLELGIGAAWFEDEHRELGIEFPSAGQRGRRLEEAVQVIKKLMTEPGGSFDGRYYQLREARYRPPPVQEPHPPIWIGAAGEKVMLPIVGRHADVWHTYGSVERIKRKSEIVERAARDAGRDPTEIRRSTGLSISEPWDEVRRRIESVAEIGVSYLTVSWPTEGQERLEEFVDEVMPDYVEREER
ncbi:MAG: TIGR03560 family F420-dependent LLM class oxidoreductase [Actinomycetota bacterium]|nr:TIGR03560 family F420-dependent LLM class oxidoreductase [Actinomycetota bacterium]